VIELASVIRDLREELERAIAAGRDEQLRFELGPIELEVAVVVKQSNGNNGKVSFWVVGAGGDRTNESATTQRIKLTLTPRLGAGTENPLVSGSAVEGEAR
jgi:hypothetical protein